MAKRLVQGPAEPVWLVGADGEPIDAAHPLDIDLVAGAEVDVSDRAARDMGKIDIAAFDVALPAGTNLLGNVGIDQTTPGTTNRVDIGNIANTTQTNDVKVTLDGEEITSPGTTISQTPTVTAGAYSAGDAVGGLLTFANAARTSGGGGVTMGVIIIDDNGQDVKIELWLFNQTFTAMSDNAAWAPSEADLENLIGIISTGDSAQGWLAAGTPSAIDIECTNRYDLVGTSLFGQLVTRGTPTFAATDDVTVKVKLLQD